MKAKSSTQANDEHLKGAESSRRMLMNSQPEVLTTAALAGWQEKTMESRPPCARDHSQTQVRREERMHWVVGFLMNMQPEAEVLLKAGFAGWREVTLESRPQYVQNLQMTVKRRDSSSRMSRMSLALRGGDVSEATYKNKINAREQETQTESLKQQNDIFQMQRNFRAKGAESSSRMLGMWLGSQAKGLSRITFAAWRDHTTVTKLNRMCQTEAVQIRSVMRSKGGESAKRMLGILMGGQAELFFKATFAAWRNAVVHERMKRMEDDFSYLMVKRQEEIACSKREMEQESRSLMLQVKARGDRRTAAYTRFLCALISLHGHGQIDVGAVVRSYCTHATADIGHATTDIGQAKKFGVDNNLRCELSRAGKN